MARPKKTTSSESETGKSATPSRKRSSSAEMSGLDKKSYASSRSRKAASAKSGSDEQDRQMSRNPEFESPEKRRGYDKDLRDDYNESGARYSSSERGETEFGYDQRYMSGQSERSWDRNDERNENDEWSMGGRRERESGRERGRDREREERGRGREREGGRDMQWGAPEEWGRQSYSDPGLESDYRHRHRGGSRRDESDYMSGRGDVPSGGYYGYQRMEGRYYDEPQGRRSQPDSYDEYGNTAGGWSNRAGWQDDDRNMDRGNIERRSQGMQGRRAGYETGYGSHGMKGSNDRPEWREGDYGSGSYRGYGDRDRGGRFPEDQDYRSGNDDWNLGSYGSRRTSERHHTGGYNRPGRSQRGGGQHPSRGYDL